MGGPMVVGVFVLCPPLKPACLRGVGGWVGGWDQLWRYCTVVVLCRGLHEVREQKEGVSLSVVHMLQNKEVSPSNCVVGVASTEEAAGAGFGM